MSVVMTVIQRFPDSARLHRALHETVDDSPATRIEVFRAVDDPLEVMIIVHVPSLEQAREIMRNAGDFLDRAGLAEYPPVFVGIAEEVIEPAATG